MKIKLMTFFLLIIKSIIFYDGTLVADNVSILYEKYYNNTVGGGLWFKMGIPVNLTIFAEFGYTIFNSWSLNIDLVFGEL
jgi:hypothetical protein